MAAASKYYREQSIGTLLSSATVYAALFTSVAGLADDDSTLWAEASGGNYAREEMDFETASNWATQNSLDVDFSTADSPWGAITHVAIMTALTAGHVLVYGALTTPRTIRSGDAPRFSAGDFDYTETG